MECRISLSPRCRPVRRNVLAASLSLLFAQLPAQASDLAQAAVPASWPLPYERSAQTTPLRARLDAMQVARAAPPGHVAATLAVAHCADDASPGSLRSVVAGAVSGDIIDLSQLTCSRISLQLGAIEIEVDELSLRGPGSTLLAIDGNDRDRVFFHPASGALILSGLTVQRGRHVAEGNDVAYGGCIATGATLVLDSVVVRNCNAVGVGAYGGGVLSGFMTMSHSTITGNTAFGDHATNGTAAYGGGAFSYGVEILDSTISRNRAIGTHNPPLSHWEIGGGLFVAHNGGLIERSTISNNYAMRFAGGLTQEGDLVLRNSTISGNVARDDDGGGLRVRQVTSVQIEGSTITDNQAGSIGGGVSFTYHARPSSITSTIIAGNRAGVGGTDIDSMMPQSISGSYNLIPSHGTAVSLPGDTVVDAALLLPLADNGGPTWTHALAPASPAIDRGSNPQPSLYDQRGPGHLRVAGAAPDIGAFELQDDELAGATTQAVPAFSVWAGLLLAALLARLGLRQMRRPD